MRSQQIFLTVVTKFLFISVVFAGVVTGCTTTTHPCSVRGDTSWTSLPSPDGDMKCQQLQLTDGSVVNHGTFKRFWKNGKPGLEGQFVRGKKHGIWFVYDEGGKKIQEKFFRDGIETSISMTDEQLKQFMAGKP